MLSILSLGIKFFRNLAEPPHWWPAFLTDKRERLMNNWKWRYSVNICHVSIGWQKAHATWQSASERPLPRGSQLKESLSHVAVSLHKAFATQHYSSWQNHFFIVSAGCGWVYVNYVLRGSRLTEDLCYCICDRQPTEGVSHVAVMLTDDICLLTCHSAIDKTLITCQLGYVPVSWLKAL
jgi:hypothetical protein